MKTMTCKQLGGACDEPFSAETFDEIAQLSQAHGKAMFEQQDPAHLDAMQAMRKRMEDPEAMQGWMARKKAEFDAL